MRIYPCSLLILLTIRPVISSTSLTAGEICWGVANPTFSEITR